jgi:hypothetical protein
VLTMKCFSVLLTEHIKNVDVLPFDLLFISSAITAKPLQCAPKTVLGLCVVQLFKAGWQG